MKSPNPKPKRPRRADVSWKDGRRVNVLLSEAEYKRAVLAAQAAGQSLAAFAAARIRAAS